MIPNNSTDWKPKEALQDFLGMRLVGNEFTIQNVIRIKEAIQERESLAYQKSKEETWKNAEEFWKKWSDGELAKAKEDTVREIKKMIWLGTNKHEIDMGKFEGYAKLNGININ